MSFISDILSGGASGLIGGLGNVVDKFVTTGDEKNAMKLELEKVVTARMAMMNSQAETEMNAKSAIIQAELNQGDNFTKRMRPTLGYFGMFAIFFNHCLVPLLSGWMPELKVETFILPTEFWIAWGGMMATYSIGRTQEKKGNGNRITSAITGTKSVVDLLK